MTEPSPGSLSRWAVAGLAVAAAGLAADAAAGPGTRLGIWGFREGIRMLRWGAYAGAAGILLSLAGAALQGPKRKARWLPAVAAGVVLGAVAFGVPWSLYRLAKSVPMIHDITTDTEDPPAFHTVLPLRTGAANSATYGGPDVAAKQRAAYPDIRSLDVPLSPAKAFDRAMDLAHRSGWTIDGANGGEGRIEATATTRWFGFKDDVVIRITPTADGGSRLDLRSESRVGSSDLGTNARRIRKFLKEFVTAPS